MQRLLECDLTKAKLKFEVGFNFNGLNDLYIAVFNNMSITYYFHIEYTRRLIVYFSDNSRLEYCIYRDGKNWKRNYIYNDQNNIIEEWSCDDIFENSISLKAIKLDKFLKNLMEVVNQAAALIQAAFRGWKVRHKYRYDPGNCLGKHLVLRMFELSFLDHS